MIGVTMFRQKHLFSEPVGDGHWDLKNKNTQETLYFEVKDKQNRAGFVAFGVYKERGICKLHEYLKEYVPMLITGNTKTEERQNIINQFQESTKPEVLLGTIGALGTGCTLTKSNYVLFLNKGWVVTDVRQAEDRCHRKGTTSNVTVVSYIVKNTLDERIEEILIEDGLNIDRIIDGKSIRSNKSLLNKLLRSDEFGS